MTCNDKCIHYPVCEQKKYDFANIDECQYYEEERPHGEWIEGSQGYFCSNCNEYDKFYFDHNFCPICGARMKGGDEK